MSTQADHHCKKSDIRCDARFIPRSASAVPAGLESLNYAYPALKGWAKLLRLAPRDLNVGREAVRKLVILKMTGKDGIHHSFARDMLTQK
jgi:hypothetical protein